jgi:prophage regulatory protein
MQSQLPALGFLRLPQIIGRRPTNSDPGLPAIIPVSRSAWWEGVRTGRFPKPIKLGPRTTAWTVNDIRDLVQKMSREAP